ncbi:MAG: LacI family DNA-binding transcriptional regulator, partial [Ruminiclostridium sp.]|nr:LacI family DNA-binding transcriptional regulator [Ruminiclostridium sp.]
MLNKGNMKIIGVVLCGAQDEATAEHITHISHYAEELNYKLLIFNSFADYFMDNTPDNPTKVIYKIINYDILDGIILLSESIKSNAVIEEIVASANARNIPVVYILTPVKCCYNITIGF